MRRVLGVAGWQGAGKTTLVAAAVRELVRRGLAVAVVKHDVHGVRHDPAGSDSDLLFAAGAEAVVSGPGELLQRRPAVALEPLLGELLRRHDLVLLEGFKGSPVDKVWLAREGEPAGAPPPVEAARVVATLSWGEERLSALVALVEQRLRTDWEAMPRRGAVLVGGASRRMGSPKHELRVGGERLLDRALAALAPAGECALLGGVAGPGEGIPAVPTPLRLPDAPGLRGPLAGLLAALRWSPVTWVVAACDLPRLRREAVEWLLAQRAPGRWAVLPVVDGEPQPLLAVYEPQALALLEEIAAAGAPAPVRLAEHSRVSCPQPPADLADAWRGANTPAELAALVDGERGGAG